MTLLCDGAPEMWNLLNEAFDADSFRGMVIHRLTDFWHAVEGLTAAANVLDAKREETTSQPSRWKLALLNRSRRAPRPFKS
ncbi:MAG: hypothetical protein KF795_22255 [Labilithrix sp.]|nr:hypothetical protein [Labilithrix sp.]